MTDPTPAYRANIRPELSPYAAELVATYDSTFGASAPYCCPEALAAVLDALAEMHGSLTKADLVWIADGLRGKR